MPFTKRTEHSLGLLVKNVSFKKTKLWFLTNLSSQKWTDKNSNLSNPLLDASCGLLSKIVDSVSWGEIMRILILVSKDSSQTFFLENRGKVFHYSYKSWSWKYFHRERYQWNWYLERKFVKIQKPILRFPRFLNFMEATKVTCSSLSMLNELKFTGIDIFIILSTNLSANLIACWSFWDASFYRFEKK